MRMMDDECRQRFEQARVLRLATVDADGVPHVVPATFAVEGSSVVIAVDHKPKSGKRLKRLRNIEANPAVTVLVDHYADDWDELWWVRADGQAHLNDAGTHPHLVSLLVDKYEQYEDRPPTQELIVIDVGRWSGWSAATD